MTTDAPTCRETIDVLIMAREQLLELYKNSKAVEWEDVDAIDAINQLLATQRPTGDDHAT